MRLNSVRLIEQAKRLDTNAQSWRRAPVVQGHDANMMKTYYEHPHSWSSNRVAARVIAGALAACLALVGMTGTFAFSAWADAPASSSGDDKAVSSSAWQAKPKNDEDKANIAQAIQQEAYAQQSESGSTGYVGPYYAIKKTYVTDIEDSFEQAAEEQNLISIASTGLAAGAVLIAILAALCLMKASRVRARANVLRTRGR